MPMIPSQEHTPEWLQKIGGRKFALTALVIIGAIVIIIAGIDPPEWFVGMVTAVTSAFSVGAGLAKAGSKPQ